MKNLKLILFVCFFSATVTATDGGAPPPPAPGPCTQQNVQHVMRLDRDGGVMQDVAPRFQYATDMCYAVGAQQLFDAYRVGQLDPSERAPVAPSAPIWLGLLSAIHEHPEVRLDPGVSHPPNPNPSCVPEQRPAPSTRHMSLSLTLTDKPDEGGGASALDEGSVPSALSALIDVGGCSVQALTSLLPDESELSQIARDIGYGRRTVSTPAVEPEDYLRAGLAVSPPLMRLYQAMAPLCRERLSLAASEIFYLRRRLITPIASENTPAACAAAEAQAHAGVATEGHSVIHFEVANFETLFVQELNAQLNRQQPVEVDVCIDAIEEYGDAAYVRANLFDSVTGRQQRRLDCGGHALTILGRRELDGGAIQYLARDSRLDRGCQDADLDCHLPCDQGNQYWIDAPLLAAASMGLTTIHH